MWNRLAHLETQQQNILFLCENDYGPSFAVQIDYAFQLDQRSLRPKELQCHAAFVEKGKALLEIR
jgi:hypothetical protein